MVAKYLFAGLISAALAGGAVWMAADAAEFDHPHDTVEKRKDADASSTATITPKAKSKASDAPLTQTESAAKTIDALLDRSDETADRDADSKPEKTMKADRTTSWSTPAATKATDSGDAPDRPTWTSTATKKTPTSDPDDAPARKAWLDDYLSRPDDGGSKKMMADAARDSDESAEREDARSRMDSFGRGDGRGTGRFVVEDGDDDRAMDRASTKVIDQPETGRSQSRDTFALLMDEAAKVDIPEARDGAYFNIMEFALTQGRDAEARAAISEISAVELRDAARTRLGETYAQMGQMDAAFAILEDIETEELVDPVRLAIIAAATGAKR